MKLTTKHSKTEVSENTSDTLTTDLQPFQLYRPEILTQSDLDFYLRTRKRHLNLDALLRDHFIHSISSNFH